MLSLKPQKLPPWTTDEGVYGSYSSKSYAKRRSRWSRDGFLTVYYSYTTIVAFRDDTGLHVSENGWSCTTGKHLNWLSPDKKSRLSRTEFMELLAKAEEENEALRRLVHKLAGDETGHDS